MEDQPVPLAAPIHPPTAPPMAGALVDAGSTSRWPTAVGTIAIIFGGFTAFGGIMGLASPLMEDAMFSMPNDAAMQAMRQVTLTWRPWTIAASVAAIVAAVPLFVGAVRLLKRRPSCRGVLLAYGAIAICQGLTNSIVGYNVQREMTTAMQHIQGSNPLSTSFGVITTIIGMLFGLMWNLSLPVFLLIWLNRDKIKQEVAGWSKTTPQALSA